MEKNKKRRSGLVIMLELIRLLGRLKYIIILAVLGGYAGNACAISVMTFGACCVAKLLSPESLSLPLGAFIALTIGAGLLRGLLRFAEQYSNHYIAFKLLAALRDRIFGKLRLLAPARLEGRQKGALIAMLTADVETLEVFYAHTISPIMIAILVDGTVAILVSVIGSPLLGLIALAAYLIIGVVIPFAASALLRREGEVYRARFSGTSAYFLDCVKGIREIVQNGRADEKGAELGRQSEEMNARTVAMKKKTAAVGAVSNLAVSLTILLSCYVGAGLVISGQLTLSYMIIALVMLFSSFGPVLSLAALPSNLTQTFASGDRILDFMEEDPVVEENHEGARLADFESMEVRHVSFAYEDRPVLQDVSLIIRKGSITGLVGPSGCGKSTLLKLMLRFYDPDRGEILCNGRDLREIHAASLRENVVMVSQDTYLFDDTILANLLLAKPEADMEEVRQACRMAAIDDFITSLPQGYDTEAGLLGDALSAGEKQRIGLARAFLSGAHLILLDEVTSNVDAINEGMILKSLRDAAGDHTIVLVSHRESTVSICDEIYRFEDGHVVREDRAGHAGENPGIWGGTNGSRGKAAGSGAAAGSDAVGRTAGKADVKADDTVSNSAVHQPDVKKVCGAGSAAAGKGEEKAGVKAGRPAAGEKIISADGPCPKELRHWQQETRLIPTMIRIYCHGHHGTKGRAVCPECQDLTAYAVKRLSLCPFKVNKQFCSFCKIHCYKPDYREKIKAVMKYSGPRMLTSHPIFAISHVLQMLKYKRSLKTQS